MSRKPLQSKVARHITNHAQVIVLKNEIFLFARLDYETVVLSTWPYYCDSLIEPDYRDVPIIICCYRKTPRATYAVATRATYVIHRKTHTGF